MRDRRERQIAIGNPKVDIWRWKYENICGGMKLYFSGVNSNVGYLEMGI